MTPADFLKRIVDPTLALLAELPDVKIPMTDEARLLVMAICGQESDWMHRIQIGGPAHGYPQFEKMGGVAEVLQKCHKQMAAVCAVVECPVAIDEVYTVMAGNDTLSCSMARFLLWQDPEKLPIIGDVRGGWNYYERNWRPGAPRPDVWPLRYAASLVAMGM